MKAWLITWWWIGKHSEMRDTFITILGVRRSDKNVAKFVQDYYMLTTAYATGLAYFANRPRKIPHKVKTSMPINGISHGDRITCGENPFIYARKVSDIVVSHNQDIETITWKEPPIFRWKDDSKSEITIAQDGPQGKLVRRRRDALKEVVTLKLTG